MGAQDSRGEALTRLDTASALNHGISAQKGPRVRTP